MVRPDTVVLTLTPIGGACLVALAVATRDQVALAVVFAIAGSVALLLIPLAVVYRRARLETGRRPRAGDAP